MNPLNHEIFMEVLSIVSMKEDVYSCNSQSAIKNKAAVPKPNYTVMRYIFKLPPFHVNIKDNVYRN